MRKKFRDIVLFARTGLNPRTNFKLNDGGDNAYITIKNIKNDKIIIDKNTDFVTDEAITLINKRSQLKKDDILFASIGRIGEMAIIKEEPYKWNINESVFVFTLNKEIIENKYFIYLFKSQKIQEYLFQNSSGSTFKSIKMNQLNKMFFDIPSLEKQQEIVSILDKLNESIDADKKQLELYDELVKSRFNEMFDDKGYPLKTIGELTSICRGASPRPISSFITKEDDAENWIKIGDVGENDIYISHTSERITHAGADKSRRVKIGDFILSNSMSFGRPYILGINGCVHDGWLIISDYQNTFEPLFFYYLLRSEEVQSQFDGSANGACVRNLNSDLVKKVNVMIPPIKLQKEFVLFANQIDKTKIIIQERINRTQELLDKKMDEYFREAE